MSYGVLNLVVAAVAPVVKRDDSSCNSAFKGVVVSRTVNINVGTTEGVIMGNAVGCISAGATEGFGAMGCAESVATCRAEGVGAVGCVEGVAAGVH